MLKIIKLLGLLLFASASCSYSSSGIAATFSEIPLDAVTIQADESSTSEDSLNFQVGVFDLPQLDPNWRLTSFEAVLTDRDGNAFPSNYRAWSGVAAPGWRAIAVAETQNNPGGYRFEVLDWQYGIARGESLSNFIARSNAISLSGEQLRISSVSSISSATVPEPTTASGIIAFGAFLSFGLAFKRKQANQRNENSST